MAERKFSGVDGAVSSPELTADYEAASRFDKVRVGKLGVYFRDGLKSRYIPYSFLERVFIRIHEVDGKLCCGSTVFHYFRLVFVHDGQEYADVMSECEKAMDDALSLIASRAPELAIGI